MKKTLGVVALGIGLALVAPPAMASDAPAGPAPVGAVMQSGGCYTDAELAGMTDAQRDALGPVPDYCFQGTPAVGPIITVSDSRHASHRVHRNARHSRR